MAQKNKFEDFEKERILSLVEILYPKILIPLREGNVEISEPDGIIIVDNNEIGIEVRRFSDCESLQRETVIKEMQIYLNNSLSNLTSSLIVQIDGNKIPIGRIKSRHFMLIVEKELLKLIPEILDDCKIEIDGVSISFLKSNNKNININFSLFHNNQDLSYSDSVIKAIEEKNTNTYSTKKNWLLLYERTNLPYLFADFEKISKHINSKANQFKCIYILTSWGAAGMVNPDAFQIFPVIRPLYKSKSV